MGVSTDAILLYGYCWDEELQLFDGDMEWPEIVARNRNNKNPWDGFPKEIEVIRDYSERQKATDNWTDEHRSALNKWYDIKKDIEKEFDVKLGYHCSGECSMPYLAVFSVTAARGYPEEIKHPSIGWDWDRRLERWLEEFNITKPHPEPKWWLVSYWG